MRHVLLRSWAAFALLVAAAPVFASGPALVALGSGREVSLEDLQQKVDAVVGAGHVNVRTDFIGAHAGDPSPWFWINDGVHAIAVTLIDRDSPRGAIGWYEETGHVPVLDGIGDGVVLTDLRVRNTRTLVRMPTAVKHFGFYILQKGDGEEHENGQTSIVYTNNLFNDPGPHNLVSDHPSPAGERQDRKSVV